VVIFSGAHAQTPQSVELEEYLYIQNPNPSVAAKGAIYVVWIPPPVWRYCVGKTAEQCSTIDFCIRTTSRQVPMCQKLSVNLARIQRYPADTRPRRLIGITYFARAPIEGLEPLLKYFESQPKATFGHLSNSVRFKARIKFTRRADDDDFDLLEVLALPPA